MQDSTSLKDPMAKFLGYHLRRASAVAMADLASALEPLKLSPTLAAVVTVIEANPGTPQSHIGQALGIKRANMAPMIARLGDLGLIRREELSGRSVGIHCSAKGNKTAAEVHKIMVAHEKRMFGDIARAEQKRMIAALRDIATQSND